jgi:hypothetical protein
MAEIDLILEEGREASACVMELSLGLGGGGWLERLFGQIAQPPEARIEPACFFMIAPAGWDTISCAPKAALLENNCFSRPK